MTDAPSSDVLDARRFTERPVAVLVAVGALSGLVMGGALLEYLAFRAWHAAAASGGIRGSYSAPGYFLTVLAHNPGYFASGLVVGGVVGLFVAAARFLALLVLPSRAVALATGTVVAFVVTTIGVYGFGHLSGLSRLVAYPRVPELLGGVIGAVIMLVAVAVIDRGAGTGHARRPRERAVAAQ